jgi:hypothetical protein
VGVVVIKTLARVLTTFALLVAGYVGYSRGFTLLRDRLGTPRSVPVLPYDPSPSRGEREAIALATTAFGPGHWATRARLKYYLSRRNYFIYTQDYERLDDGKRLELKPFALIWRSRDGQALKTLTSQRATLVFNRAPDMAHGTDGPDKEPRIVHARIEGDVRIRDDKGTPAHLGDDLTIALTHVDYDEASETISSDSDIIIRDRDTIATGEGLVIELLPSGPSPGAGAAAGYAGARTIRLQRDVKITVQDVGRTGVVPGGLAQPETADGQREPRPGEITCKGELRIDLPPPVVPPRIGPPAPQGPTLAHFAQQVRVRQGDAQNPEQLDCDRLHLTLVPAPRKRRPPATPEPGDAAEALVVAQADSKATPPDDDAPTSPDPTDGGPVSELVLQRARATGQEVWLQSKAHGLVALGNELNYLRRMPAAADTTYFRGDRFTEIRKRNLSDGTFDQIRTADVTLHHTGPAGEPASIVARGPGWLKTFDESGPAVVRSARWDDQVVIQPVADDPTRRQLTLDGHPEVHDTLRGSLTARQKIVAWLVQQPKAAAGEEQQGREEKGKAQQDKGQAAAPAEVAGELGSRAFRIEMMQAWGDVTLVSNGSLDDAGTAPGGLASASQRTITARQWLGVVFEQPADDAKPKPVPADQAVAPQVAAAPADPPKPAGAKPKPKPDPPADPPMTVAADRIWAWVVQVGKPAAAVPAADAAQDGAPKPAETANGLAGATDAKWDIREVRLRGQVIVHQDAPPEKSRGLDVKGEEVDVIAQDSPRADEPDTRDRAPRRFEVWAFGRPERWAWARTDTFKIEGPLLHVDQMRHRARVNGPGKLVQEQAGAGFLGDALPDAALEPALFDPDRPPRDADAAKRARALAEERERKRRERGPLSIAWGRDALGVPLPARTPDGQPIETWMTFEGKPTDTHGRALPAKAIFHNGVRAWTNEAVLTCGELTAYLDDQVDFTKPPRRRAPTTAVTDADVDDPAPLDALAGPPPAPPARITHVVCEDRVCGVSRKFDDDGLLIELRRVAGDLLTYDVPTNRFRILTAGMVDLIDRGNTGMPADPSRRTMPLADPGRANVRPASYSPQAAAGVRRGAAPARRPLAVAPPPLKMTRIWFDQEMIGQLNTTRAGSKRLAGQAEFFGNVRVMNAVVADEDIDLDPDRPPASYLYSRSRTARVISEPPPTGAPEDAPDRVLVQAWDDVFALTVRQGRETSIQADDHMDYNSETGTSYIYGREQEVTIVDQAGMAQPASFGRGRTVRYNHLTGAIAVLDARSIQLVDPGSGVRAGIPPAPPPPANVRPRRKLYREGPTSNERRNFTGR